MIRGEEKIIGISRAKLSRRIIRIKQRIFTSDETAHSAVRKDPTISSKTPSRKNFVISLFVPPKELRDCETLRLRHRK